jgi:hypothetical protein
MNHIVGIAMCQVIGVGVDMFVMFTKAKTKNNHRGRYECVFKINRALA